MERYKLVNNEPGREQITTTKIGYFTDVIRNKHSDSYGDERSKDILFDTKKIFDDSQKQYYNSSVSNNMLLVGKVQSGKTSTLEMFTAISLDNGYNLIIIYGGYDKNILKQTTDRFRRKYGVFNEDEDCDLEDSKHPLILSTHDEDSIEFLDDTVSDALECNKPVFVISLKRRSALGKVNTLIKKLDLKHIKSLIIDDEGDQASLNTEFKKNNKSATYSEIEKMKNILNNPLYLSVTATPEANVLLGDGSVLQPSSIRLIEPGNGYCGASIFHLSEGNNIYLINGESEAESLDSNILPRSMKLAINHYIISIAIMKLRDIREGDMIIHSHRIQEFHQIIYNLVDAYLQQITECINDREKFPRPFETFMGELEKCYKNEDIFPLSVQSQYDFSEIKENICYIVSKKKIKIVIHNSSEEGKRTQAGIRRMRYKIYVGGDLLQRGLTFNLVTTYFTRWAESGGNMDTNLQRARWFGYRNKFIDLSKVFTTTEISKELTTLSEIEDDLWLQFQDVQAGNMSIKDILIDGESTKQKPTRSNVVSYRKVVFKRNWIKQQYGLFDEYQLHKNNEVVDKLLSQFELTPTFTGYKNPENKKPSGHYAMIPGDKLREFLIELKEPIFSSKPFEFRTELINKLISLTDQYPVILMHPDKENGGVRSFYRDLKIQVLQQGSDDTDKNLENYQGDSSVIIDKTKVNIQIHKILPRWVDDKQRLLSKYTQYMFAIYIPIDDDVDKHIFFVRGDGIER